MSWPNVVCCLGVVASICATLVAIAALDLKSPNRRYDSEDQ